MQRTPIAKFYSHFSSEARRPYVEDHSLQLFYPESVETVYDVKQLYNNYQFHSVVSSEYEASLHSIHALEREFMALRAIAKELQKAYQDVLDED